MTTLTTGRATDFITFSRPGATGGGATVTDRDGKIKWAGHNLLTNSESFDAISWTKDGGSSVTANTVVAPNGTTTADTLTDSAVAGQQRAYQAVNVIAGQIVTLAVFLKQGTRRYARVTLNNGNDASVVADLQVGTITQYAHPDWTIHGTSITPIGDSWYRVSITASRAAVTQYYAVVAACNVASGISDGYSYTGNGSTIHLWGAHLYRSDLGGMVLNPARGDAYYPTTVRNMLGFTEDFSNAAWGKISGSVTATNVIAPNGLQTADAFTPTNSSAAHYISTTAFNPSTLSASLLTISVYLRPNGYTKFGIREQSIFGAQAAFTLSGSGSTFAVITGSATANTASITPLSDGWYRCSMTITGTGSYKDFRLYVLDPSYTSGNMNDASWTADGTSGIYLWGAQLSDSASLDAYSPVYGAAVTSAAYYAPRLDFDANGSALGLLVEEQRTNLILRSQEFDNASWGKNSIVTPVPADAILAPTGTSVAETITAANATASHYLDQSITWTAVVHTVSVYVKRGTQQFFQITTWDGTTSRYANFDILNGTPGTTNNATSTITPVGDSWYRVTLTTSTAKAAAAGNITFAFASSASSGANPSFATVGTETFYLFGAQVEAGSFATSYIPNGAATSGATRTADVASVSTQAFPYSATEGTVVVSATVINTAVNSNRYIGFNLASSQLANRMIDVFKASPQYANYKSSDAQQTGFGVWQDNSKVGVVYKADDYVFVANGGTVVTDTSTSGLSTADTMVIGQLNGSNQLNGHIRQITYLPRRLPNADLIARTV